MYKALVDFKDLASGQEYKAGDIVDLSDAPATKILFMITPNNSRGALIEEVGEKSSEIKDEPTEEVVEESVEEPQGV